MHLVSKENSESLIESQKTYAIRSLPQARAQLVEMFADFRDSGATGFALAQVPRGGRILWIQDRMVTLETGRPCGEGCTRFGCDMDRFVLACARGTADLLWAMEEGLRCGSLAAIIGEIRGNPRALDFTASKRLAMRAERQGIPVFLIRYDASADLSAARQRWHVRSLPSAPHPYDAKAPGAPRWHAELFRTRRGRPGAWAVEYDRAAHRLDLVSPLSHPAVDPADAAVGGTSAAGRHPRIAAGPPRLADGTDG